MKLFEAIARSPGNKAEASNDRGQLVIVQERYGEAAGCWWHAWLLGGDNVSEVIMSIDSDKLKRIFLVDSSADYWSPVGGGR